MQRNKVGQPPGLGYTVKAINFSRIHFFCFHFVFGEVMTVDKVATPFKYLGSLLFRSIADRHTRSKRLRIRLIEIL